MLDTKTSVIGQGTITAAQAIVMANERFPNLTASGILGAKQSGQPIDLSHIDRALQVLSKCRQSKTEAEKKVE